MALYDFDEDYSNVMAVCGCIGLEYVRDKYIYFHDMSVPVYPDNNNEILVYIDEEARGTETEWLVMSQDQIEQVSSFEKDVRSLIEKYESIFRK